MNLQGQLLGLVGGSLCLLATLSGCAKSGSDIASDTADDVVDAYVERIDRLVRTPAPAQNLAAMLDELEEQHFSTGQGGGGTVMIDPLSWKGSTRDDDGAVVEARISVTVPAYDSGAMFGTSYEAGSAVRCFRFVVKVDGHTTDVDDMSCPAGAPPKAPGFVPKPTIPKDAETRLKTLLRSTTATRLSSDVRAAFDADGLFTDTADDGGRFIATVGTVGGEHCLVAVRAHDGTVTFPYVPREWIMPGETGCHPALVTSPPS